MESTEFANFLAAVRSGNREAAEALVRQYEPYVRRVVGLRLHDSRLRRLFDSMDICQSIMASFLAHAAAGDFELENSRQLAGLLARMALNKLVTKARAIPREEGAQQATCDPIDPYPSPADAHAEQEFLGAVRAKLSAEELALFEKNRVEGRTWDEIAGELGEGASALRMRLTRALNRARLELQREGMTRVE
jgi:RNA polymerase sigma-70 factor (ECF subfamily)